MALNRLPNDVQSLLCASAQINSFKRAVEELLFNSLDSESTSIAIRIHIHEGTIQVIDNGYGITKHDFNALGQRYMTSKITDISTFKAAPKTYGYRGEFLPNIITVSQMVKIISRHKNTEETWAKTFLNGKEKKFAKMSTRPSNGTTVDIKGFLYNHNIQKRGINPINELQNIKQFLEQLSLVHNNISLSLRDDSKNEIIFKIHKKRDIYQTLSTLFDIDTVDIQELQVEKNEYKVKGIIGKTRKELDLHWIYLNGKFIHSSSKLHKEINNYFKKCLPLKDHRKIKSKKNNEEQLFNRNIPFYFIFVTCPYIDYDINLTSTHATIEFKNWEQISKLLEKLIKFYVGDVNLKEIKRSEIKMKNNEKKNIECPQDTRDQVKKIMNKILGSNSKKLGVSQLQNGVKGKLVKRKIKKNANKKSTNISTLFRQNENQNTIDDKGLSKSKFEMNHENNVPERIKRVNNNLNECKEHKTLTIPKHRDKKRKASNPKKYTQEEIKMQKNRTKTKKLLPTKKTKQQNVSNKYKKLNVHINDCKVYKMLKDTDSVYKRSKIVARKAEEFLQYHTRKRNVTQKENNIMQGKKNMITRKTHDNNAFNDYVPRTRQINKYIIGKYVMDKLKTKSFKTTYDLVQTIQQVTKNNNMSKEFYSEFSDFNYRRNDKTRSVLYPKTSTWINKYILSEYSDFVGKQRKSSQYTTRVPIYYKKYDNEGNYSEVSAEESGLMCEDIYNINNNIECERRQESSYFTSNVPLESKLTYESHHYHENEVFETNLNAYNICSMNKRQNVRFITKQSKDNFVTVNDLRTKIKRPSKSIFNHKQTKINDIRMKQMVDESFIIEYSKSNENDNDEKVKSDILINSMMTTKVNENLQHKINVNHENKLPDNKQKPIIGDTYTIQPFNDSFGTNIESQYQFIQSNEFFNTYSIHYSNSEVNNDMSCKPIIDTDEYASDRNNLNVVFVSKSQCSKTDTPFDNNIEPLNVCETILHESHTVEREFAFNFNQTNNQRTDSLYENIRNIGDTNECLENEPFQITHHGDVNCAEKKSHHFNNTVNTKQSIVIDNTADNSKDSIQILRRNEIDNINEIKLEHLPNLVIERDSVNGDNINCNIDSNYFNFKNRLRFVPKGLSQIFENCRSKTTPDFDLDKDYYEDSIYNNFANDVQVNSEIYEPIIQNVEELTTKNIHKFQTKVKKDNASLVFDETSLKEARVLGQVDCKFIAAIMKKRCDELEEGTEYLILFDQHAVHERIRLEKNLADYINEDRWRSVPLDNVILKMSNDEILYLHNYKDKFNQLGLQWNILNDNVVTVNSIPEAILGKNPREVEKVIKAVRNLIIEEITVIKLQKGCVSLYPKSIMDLVFSEACRYAIKFGDQLSQNDCVELLAALSGCKTPFQCAHGRPVMAVIVDIKYDSREYKVNMAKLNRYIMKKYKSLI